MSVDNTRSDSYGTWLVIISMSTRSILCKVRIDDHDHQLVLSEIRDMIHNKLKDNRHNTEYCHGFTFGIGWPLKIVTKEEEHTILAQSVLPFVSVLSTQSAQHISNKHIIHEIKGQYKWIIHEYAISRNLPCLCSIFFHDAFYDCNVGGTDGNVAPGTDGDSDGNTDTDGTSVGCLDGSADGLRVANTPGDSDGDTDGFRVALIDHSSRSCMSLWEDSCVKNCSL
eukprot:838888_1